MINDFQNIWVYSNDSSLMIKEYYYYKILKRSKNFKMFHIESLENIKIQISYIDW
jgi:hypothetical protein